MRRDRKRQDQVPVKFMPSARISETMSSCTYCRLGVLGDILRARPRARCLSVAISVLQALFSAITLSSHSHKRFPPPALL